MSENSIRSGRVYYVYDIDLKLNVLRERPRQCLQDIEERILLIIEHACTCLLGGTSYFVDRLTWRLRDIVHCLVKIA